MQVAAKSVRTLYLLRRRHLSVAGSVKMSEA